MHKAFQCDKCGKCCENLDRSEEYRDLDDGTGTCIYFDKQTRLCKIYDSRPERCNIQQSYKRFESEMSYDEYLEMNLRACEILKRGL